ncbi:hypothetical protein G6L37_03170 [Agrobacterium rubi]|nr:hypothetical protein [Agrobacterium rubi]NTF24376.1 hypothetical protein [Agrobacterium rubi]
MSRGDSGTPWIAELMQPSGEGMVYLEMDKAPQAGAGDDILTMAEMVRHRDGRLIAKAVGLDAQHASAISRLRAATKESIIDAEWKVLSAIVAAEKNGDVRIGIDRSAISVVRPFATMHPAKELLARHGNQNTVAYDAPRYVLDPLVYAATARDMERRQHALPAGIDDPRITHSGPSVTPSFGRSGETKAWLLYFGQVENCSYTQLAAMSGRGMVPKADVPAALAHEFFTLHEYAHTFDDNANDFGRTMSPGESRKLEAFADAFAVTELVMAGRSPRDIERIVACREAAIVGLPISANGKRMDISQVAHFSGAAARAALVEAAAAVKLNRRVNTAELIRQARRISEKHTIGDAGMRDLQSALGRLRKLPGEADVRTWLASLIRSTSDPALKANATALHRNVAMFYAPAQQAAAAARISAVHATSLRNHLEYSRENISDAGMMAVLAEKEAAAWDIGNRGGIARVLRRLIPDQTSGIQAGIASNLKRIATEQALPSASAVPAPALAKLQMSDAGIPNPWTFSVAGRLEQCASYASTAYGVIAAVAVHGIPSSEQQASFIRAMRGLSAFVDSVTLRDASKDGKSVRKRFEDNPELEDYLRMVASYRYSDMQLPVDDGKRLQLQAVILAINPNADIPEMPKPVFEPQIPEFGGGFIPATDRE